MFCGKCGKKVHDDMLFCPFCGCALVVPDQDEELPTQADEPRVDSEQTSFDPLKEEAPQMRRPRRISLFDDSAWDDEPDPVQVTETGKDADPFDDRSIPGDSDGNAYDPPMTDSEQDRLSPEYDTDEYDRYDAPTPETKKKTTSEKSPSARGDVITNARRSSDTLIPVRNTRPEELFLGMDSEDDHDDYDDYDDDRDDDYDDYDDDYDDADDYDAYDEDEDKDDADDDEDYDFDDEEQESFFKRHKIMLLIMAVLLVVVIAFGTFVCLLPGQKLLARVNLAWNPKAYAAVGYSDFHDGEYTRAAREYAKALEMEPGNYEYAHSAMVCYYEANDVDNAAEMAIKCIEMHPDDSEPYRELMSIYGSSEKPARVRNYIQQGYSRTGDEYLNLNNW